MTRLALPLLSAGLLLAAGSAEAGLEICNATDVTQTVAIGYSGDEDWTSEGWWIVAPGDCTEAVEGDLQQRFYYIRALSDGGVIEGDYSFCVQDEAFTIIGDTDCEDRGYRTVDFDEIDTGPTALSYSYTIGQGDSAVEPEDDPAPPVDDVFDARDAEGNPRVGGSRLSARELR